MAKPNNYYDVNPQHPDADAFTGGKIGEIVRLQRGDVLGATAGYGTVALDETYMLHLAQRSGRRMTVPSDGHIIVDGISRHGWNAICDAVSGADDSFRGVERALLKMPQLKPVRVMTSSIGLVTQGGYR